MEEAAGMKAIADSSISKDADKIKQQFHTLLAKAKQGRPAADRRESAF